MAKDRKHELGAVEATNGNAQEMDCEVAPRSLVLAAAGVKSASDFAQMMSALMSDLLEGRVTPNTGNAVVNAGGKLLKVVEMRLKYGVTTVVGKQKALELVDMSA